MIVSFISLLVGVVIGLVIKIKVASDNLKKAHDILNKVEANMASLKNVKVMEQLSQSSEFILITKMPDNEYYFSAICEKEMVRCYCPPIFNFYEYTDNAVDEWMKITNYKK